jgi:hypothetical protein
MIDGRRARFLYDIGFAGRVRGGLHDTADETAWRAEIGWPVFQAREHRTALLGIADAGNVLSRLE